MKRIRPYNVYWLVWTLVLTAAAAGVRVWQESTAFEGQYGFPVRGATAPPGPRCGDGDGT